MSASAQQLPDRASLGFLRKQAKELHRTYVAGDLCSGTHPPSPAAYRGYDTDELSQTKVSLQEAQHALASEYGFRRWVEMLAVVRPCIDDILLLTDRETQILLRCEAS